METSVMIILIVGLFANLGFVCSAPAAATTEQIIQNDKLPPLIFPQIGKTRDQVQTDAGKMPPMIFPKDHNLYKVGADNETAFKILQHQVAMEKDSEVADLIGSKAIDVTAMTEKDTGSAKMTTATATSKIDNNSNAEDYYENVFSEENAQKKATAITPQAVSTTAEPVTTAVTPTSQSTIKTEMQENQNSDSIKKSTKNSSEKDYNSEDYFIESEEDPKDEVEEFQNAKKPSNTAELEEQFNRVTNNWGPEVVDNIVVDYPRGLDHGHIAALFIVGIVILATSAYFALVYYRNQLEKRYGSRQQLVTDDDWSNDGREFEL